jgi:peptidoglycan/LPS O-acetylase OafA/YrhL
MQDRKQYLDGLRGVAAVFVVIEHMSALFPFGFWTLGKGVAGDIATGIADFPFRAGSIAVWAFFIISGIVISGSAVKRPPLLKVIMARYVRLTVPMVATLLLAAMLFAAFPNEMPAVYALNPSHWSAYSTAPPTAWRAASQGLWGEYLYGEHDIDNVIWSMRVELVGSIGLYLFYAITSARYRVAGLALLSVALVAGGTSMYLGFTIGAAFFELGRVKRVTLSAGVGVSMLLAGLGMCMIAHEHRPYLFNAIGSTLVMAAVLWTQSFRAALASAVPVFLGRISFGLYLSHMPLLYSAFGALYVAIGPVPSGAALLGLGAFFVASALLMAWVVTVLVDEPAAAAAKAIQRLGRRAGTPAILASAE